MKHPFGASSCGIGACRAERGLVCSGRPLNLTSTQYYVKHRRRPLERFVLCASAFRPCIDIHQAS